MSLTDYGRELLTRVSLRDAPDSVDAFGIEFDSLMISMRSTGFEIEARRENRAVYRFRSVVDLGEVRNEVSLSVQDIVGIIPVKISDV